MKTQHNAKCVNSFWCELNKVVLNSKLPLMYAACVLLLHLVSCCKILLLAYDHIFCIDLIFEIMIAFFILTLPLK